MSYIYGDPSKARNANVVYIYGPTFGNAETVSFYLLHNVSTLNQCREVSCVTFVCEHFASCGHFLPTRHLLSSEHSTLLYVTGSVFK